MLRETTLAPYDQWDKPFVSEVAAVLNLLRDHGYDGEQLAYVTGLQQKNMNSWMAHYRNEPDNISAIPYPCWCFLCALIGKDNIQSNGRVVPVDVRHMLSFFKPTAFRPNDKFVCPTTEQFSHLIDNEDYDMLTTDNLSTLFNWQAAKFTYGIEHGSVPFLNWCLIVMTLGINIQKMILKDLQGTINIDPPEESESDDFF